MNISVTPRISVISLFFINTRTLHAFYTLPDFESGTLTLFYSSRFLVAAITFSCAMPVQSLMFRNHTILFFKPPFDYVPLILRISILAQYVC